MKRILAALVTLIVALIAALWVVVLPQRALGVGFGGPGYFISLNHCTDLTTPVASQSVCWDATSTVLLYWNGTAWVGAAPSPFPLGATANFNGYSGTNLGGVQLTKQPPPSAVTVTATCSGTCATTYTYEVTCLNDTGESNASPATTGTNASSLSVGNNNVISWTPAPACYGGYNVYGRIGGSLGELVNVPPAGNPSDTCTPAPCYTDNGAATAGASYKLSFNATAYPAVTVWDLQGAQGIAQSPIDARATARTGVGTTESTNPITTGANHSLQLALFALTGNAGTFTPPGGFSNALNIGGVPNVNLGLWGGTKDIAAAGAVASVSGTTTASKPWVAMTFAIFAANPSVAITVPASGTLSAVATSPYKSVTFGDPAGASLGDLEVVCVDFNAGTTITVPQSFQLIGATQAPFAQFLNCYLNTAQGTTPPPATNYTGTLSQATANGQVYREVLAGLVSWSASSLNTPNGASGAVLQSTSFPVPLTITGCRVAWSPFTACSPFPVFGLKDITAGVVLCSSGTVTGSAVDQAVTPSSYTLPANDELGFLATTTGASCTAGAAAMTIQMHQ